MSQYFDQLPAPKTNQHGFISSYLANIRLVALIIIGIILVGAFSYTNLPRRLNPEVNIPFVIVNTILPGANPADIERLITIPLEDALTTVENTAGISSTSTDNVSTIAIEFSGNTDPDKATNDVRRAVDTVTSLPSDALAPRVNQVNIEDQPVWTFTLTGTTDTASLSNLATNLKDRLESSQLIKRVETTGNPKSEVRILISSQALEKLNLSPPQINSSISSALRAYPAGIINSGTNLFSLSLDPSINSLDELRQLPITVGNQVIKLSDIASISIVPESTQHTSFIMRPTDNQPLTAISFAVYKTDSANITDAVNHAKNTTNQLIEPYNQITLTTIDDNAQSITNQFNDLVRSFAGTISLVFLTLFLFLGIRQALIVSIAIPLTFLVSLAGMQVTGLSINFLSLFSLLLSLGLVVDTAIVIISAMTSYYRTGKYTPLQTGILVWKDFLTPIWATTLTTVWAFVPLLLATGIIGEFIKTIPIVVTTTLLASTGIALFITLPLMVLLLKPSVPNRVITLFKLSLTIIALALINSILPASPFKPFAIISAISLLILIYYLRRELTLVIKNKFNTSRLSEQLQLIKPVFRNGVIDVNKITGYYKRVLEKILFTQKRRRYAIGSVVVFSIFSYLLVPAGLVTNEFFPKSDFESLFVIQQRSPGTNNQLLQNDLYDLLPILSQTQDVGVIMAEIGRGNPMSDSPGSNASIRYTISLPPLKERKNTSMDIAQELRQKLTDYPHGKISVVEVSGGPPVGVDIQISILGPELEEIDRYTDQVIDYLNNQAGVVNTSKSILPGTSKVVFQPDLDAINRYGTSLDQIGLTLRTYASGFSTTDITLGNQTYEINFRATSQDPTPEELNTLTISTPQGPVSINTLGKFSLAPNPTAITRQDGQRTISVSANTTPDASATTINQGLEEFADSELNMAPDYRWQTGGVNEENQRSVQSIIQAMIVAAILILTTMVVLLGSFRKAFIILLSIPLAISGVFIMFALTSTPLSFPALIGVLALFGIVVNNAILLLDKINQNLNTGIKLKASVIDAGTSRLEPILFSSLTTMIGLIPITLSDPLWRGLGGAIISGLSISGLIMLIFIPTVYYSVFKQE